MAKCFCTQGAAVLLSHADTLDEIERLLQSFRIVKREDKGTEPDLSGPSLSTVVLAMFFTFGCGKSSTSTETAARGSQDESQRLSVQCAEILAKSFGVTSTGNA